MKKILASASAAALLTGCLGQNALFDTVQDWNSTASNNKFVNQGISFVFWWVPVYGLSLLGDIIIFNSIEFWTGTNRLGNEAELTYHADGSISVLAAQESYTLIKQGDQVIKVQDDKREVLGSVMM